MQGDNIIPLLRPWSTVTIIESNPSVMRGRSVMKSIPKEPKSQCDPLGIGWREGLVGRVETLNC